MIKTVNLQKIFKTEEVETWALNNVNLCPIPPRLSSAALPPS